MSLDIRLIATDLDGTLLGENSSISPENIAALHEAAKRGIHIAICSGRDAHNISDIAQKALLPNCAILGLNGSYVLDRPHGQVLYNHLMDSAAAKACLDILFPHDPELLICAQNRFGLYNSAELAKHLHATGRGDQIASTEDSAYLYTLAQTGLNKIVYTHRTDPAKLHAVRKEIEAIPNVTVTSSWHSNIEIMPVGIDKGIAVAKLAERLGISLSQVIAFGDNDNDMPMLTTVGYGVAMGNAIEDVLARVPYRTKTNFEHGVAEGIQRIVFEGDGDGLRRPTFL